MGPWQLGKITMFRKNKYLRVFLNDAQETFVLKLSLLCTWTNKSELCVLMYSCTHVLMPTVWRAQLMSIPGITVV